jgi:hypothetical protein
MDLSAYLRFEVGFSSASRDEDEDRVCRRACESLGFNVSIHGHKYTQDWERGDFRRGRSCHLHNDKAGRAPRCRQAGRGVFIRITSGCLEAFGLTVLGVRRQHS